MSSSRIVFLNGRFIPSLEASVSPLDRGFLFGDGVYEVISAYNHCPFNLLEHIERLASSLKAIQIQNPYTIQEWATILGTLLEKNRSEGCDFVIYCQVTRGSLTERRLEVPFNLTPTVFAMATPFTPPSIESLAIGIKAITLPDLRSQHTHIKSTSLLANTLMRLEAQAQQAAEVIVIHEGYAIEAISSNIFMVKDHVLYTPPLSPRLVGGVTRENILTLCHQHHIAYKEQDCPVSLLYSADELMVTGSTKEIVPVIQLNDKPVGNGQAGPLWHTLIQAYKQLFS